MRKTGFVLVALVAFLAGCGGGGGGGGGGGLSPVIANINGSTTPASPTGVAIEINGTGFGPNAGIVRFAQTGMPTIDVAPTQSGAWTDTNILVTVPGSLAAPGSASVSVIPPGAFESNAVSLAITTTPAFNPSSITWTTTTALPAALRAHAAVAVRVSATQAFVYVLGGNEGAMNVGTVRFATLDANGNVGAWQFANPLPATRAFLATATADSTNSAVAAGQTFIYAIGGQQASSDTPGGTATVYQGAVDLSTGNVVWTMTTSLPETRVGARAAVRNGFLHVTGGLSATGAPIAATATAPINANGSLRAFSEPATANLPVPVAFHETFSFGGFLYVIGGGTSAQTTPLATTASTPTDQGFFAPVRQGVVGSWVPTSRLIKARERFTLLFAFGQLLAYEGLYGATNFEAERSAVLPDGSLGSWNGQTGSSNPNLNTFNTAGVTSPLLTTGNSPRFLLIGGDSAASPGNLTTTVARTSAP